MGTSISQISKDLNLYKSTVYRTLVTLQSRGYVNQDKRSEKYSLGSKFYLLSRNDMDNSKKLVNLVMRLTEKSARWDYFA